MGAWYFRDLCSGYEAIFSVDTEADKFVKEYGMRMYDLNGQFPVHREDYLLNFLAVDPDISELDNIFDN